MSALISIIRRFWAKGGRDKVEKAWYSVYVCLYTGLSTYKNNNNNKLYFHSHKKFQLQQNSISHKQSWTETETPNFSFKTFLSPRKPVQIFTVFITNISWNEVFKITLTRDFSHIFYWRQTWICTSLLLLKWPIQITQKPSLTSSSHNKEWRGIDNWCIRKLHKLLRTTTIYNECVTCCTQLPMFSIYFKCKIVFTSSQEVLAMSKGHTTELRVSLFDFSSGTALNHRHCPKGSNRNCGDENTAWPLAWNIAIVNLNSLSSLTVKYSGPWLAFRGMFEIRRSVCFSFMESSQSRWCLFFFREQWLLTW